MTNTTRKETYREFRNRQIRFNDSLIKRYRSGELTLDKLNEMVDNGEITIARRNITVGTVN